MTVETGIRKYDAKKAGMISKYRLDAPRWVQGLTRAGAPPGPLSQAAYSGASAYATANYQSAMTGATGAFWAERFRAGISH